MEHRLGGHQAGTQDPVLRRWQYKQCFHFDIYLECLKAQQFAQLASKQQVSNVSLWRLVTIQFNCELGFCDNLMINSAIKHFQHSPGPSQIKFNESAQSGAAV